MKQLPCLLINAYTSQIAVQPLLSLYQQLGASDLLLLSPLMILALLPTSYINFHQYKIAANLFNQSSLGSNCCKALLPMLMNLKLLTTLLSTLIILKLFQLSFSMLRSLTLLAISVIYVKEPQIAANLFRAAGNYVTLEIER